MKPRTRKIPRSIVNIDPEIMGGTPVFRGTRVPIETLWDYIEDGLQIEEFLDDFPSVTREMALRALDEAREKLLVTARAH